MLLDGPILDKVKINLEDSVDFSQYPFSLKVVKNLEELTFPTQVTFFVGENGTGKSTFLEAIAMKAGFGKEGGSKNINFTTADEKFSNSIESFSSKMVLSWRKKPKDGYFFRAESFFNLANKIDELAKDDIRMYPPYGGKSLHEGSHGESFFSFFKNRLGNGFYIFDEPEAALSPQKQLSLLVLLHELCKNPETQFIIATHSPILLSFPNSKIYSFDQEKITPIKYEDTDHYKVTKDFLENPKRYFQNLFN